MNYYVLKFVILLFPKLIPHDGPLYIQFWISARFNNWPGRENTLPGQGTLGRGGENTLPGQGTL